MTFGFHDALFVHRSLRRVYNYAAPYDEHDCYHKAFIISNGVPVAFTRDLFYRLDFHAGQRLLFDYLAQFALNKTGRAALPFVLH